MKKIKQLLVQLWERVKKFCGSDDDSDDYLDIYPI